MLKKLIDTNVNFVVHKPKLVLLIAFILTVISVILASSLQIELSWVAMAPKNDPAVVEYQEILENFPTMDQVLVILEGDDETQIEAAANDLSATLLANSDYISNVTLGVDRDFLIDYSLLYLDPDSIDMMTYLLSNPNIDGFLQMMEASISEATKAYDQGDLTQDELEEELSTLKNLTYLFNAYITSIDHGEVQDAAIVDAIERIFVGNGMITMDNGHMAMVMVTPSFDMLDLEKLNPGVAFIEDTVTSIDQQYGALTMKVTGMHIVGRDEEASVASDSQLTTLLSAALILLILYIVFRSFLAPIFAFVPLLFGIIWTMGISSIIIGRLNMMTIFSAAMLIGLGIDYAIHMYSSYSEKRVNGLSKEASIREAIVISGPGIITGAMTTAVAFYALNISQLDLLSELGTLMGTGILTTLVAVFWILPALLTLRKEKSEKIAKMKGEFTWIGQIASFVHRFKYLVLVIMIALTVFMGYKATDITFDTNLMNLEPEGLASIEVMDYLVDTYGISATSFNIQVDSLEEVYALQDSLEAIDGVYEVTSVASVLPMTRTQNERLSVIDQNRDMLEAIKVPLSTETATVSTSIESLRRSLIGLGNRHIVDEVLSDTDLDNLISSMDTLSELISNDSNGAMISSINNQFYTDFSGISDRMLAGNPESINDLPQAFRDQYISADGQHFIINVVPDFDIWSNLSTDKGEAFFAAIQEVNPSVTGTPIFMKVLFDSVESELALTGSVLFAILLLILLMHFRSIKYALLAMLPLAFTLIFMVGIMVLTHQAFNMLNFLSILLVIGIGLDDGVHILHHYKEGQRSIHKLFSSVGRAISLTTITTILGFGSLTFSSYRGMATLGLALVIGVACAFVMTVLLLPIFLKDEA